MKAFHVIRVFRVSAWQLEQIEAVLRVKAKCPPSLGSGPLFADFELEESRPFDFKLLEDFCQKNDLRFWKLRRRSYTKKEIETTEFFVLADEPLGSNANETQYSNEDVCPNCGIGLRQKGPLIVKLDRTGKREMFSVSLRESLEWIITAKAAELFKDCSGFHLGPVSAPEKSKLTSNGWRQIMIEGHLPRMATIANFTEYDPPMKNRCSCNRAGWNLKDETIYERGVLRGAKDFNLTVERWHGGGRAGLKWPIVSRRVRQIILDNKLLKPSCFAPVHLIEKDPGDGHKFDLPLDSQP